MSELVRASKLLSLVLRHQPEAIGLVLDEQGWADIDELVAKANATRSAALTIERVVEIVRSSDKQRFALSDDGRRVRANQGHSVPVDLGLQPVQPPELLYHGTALKTLPGIRAVGLLPMTRQHVHLSADADTARRVGGRHGKPVVLEVRSGDMARDGYRFYQAANGVWLTEQVPVGAIVFPRAVEDVE